MTKIWQNQYKKKTKCLDFNFNNSDMYEATKTLKNDQIDSFVNSKDPKVQHIIASADLYKGYSSHLQGHFFDCMVLGIENEKRKTDAQITSLKGIESFKLHKLDKTVQKAFLEHYLCAAKENPLFSSTKGGIPSAQMNIFTKTKEKSKDILNVLSQSIASPDSTKGKINNQFFYKKKILEVLYIHFVLKK